jgi:hypothetical protein
MLFMPITSIYSLLADRVVDIKPLFWKELRYALARYAVLLFVVLPFLVIGTLFFLERQQPISRLFSGATLLFLLVTGSAALVVIRLRRNLLGTLNRHFFREAYDSQSILVSLVEMSRRAETTDELCEALGQEIDRALHLTSVSVFAINPHRSFLVSPDRKYRPLSVTSPLATLIAGDTKPMGTDDGAEHLLEQLPPVDRRWIEDGGFRLLVPMLGLGGCLLGTIALGKKRSGLPFSDADRLLLSAVSAIGALGVEARLVDAPYERKGTAAEVARDTGQALGEESEPAAECPDCGRLDPPRSVTCTRCGGRLKTGSVPYVLKGKFRLDDRIGSGGMGVVYRAVDLTLGRTVAIKTLPAMSPAYSHRLHREARVMAQVQHPNLAMIYGAETWFGTPMLIFEYMERGTLQDRITGAPFDPHEVVALGMTLLHVLERIHAVGILHRDIKPSNIGFVKDGQVKLLDFGLAHIVIDSRRQRSIRCAIRRSADLQEPGSDTGPSPDATWTRNLIGTPAYLSPEALRGLPPEASFDLWSLSIVLYEALTGKNPLQGGSVRETLARVVAADIPDIREVRRDLTEPVARFFETVLSKNRARRPQRATEMMAELERMGSVVRGHA